MQPHSVKYAVFGTACVDGVSKLSK